MQRLITLGLLFSTLILAVLSSAAIPQSSAQTKFLKQYAAKFVCGKTDGPLAARGQYFTIINVHNPIHPHTNFSSTVEFKKGFALGGRDEQVGKIAPYCQTSLKEDEVMGIDCPNIYKHLGIREGTFIEGFAVIQATADLDVVSVYTAGGDEVNAFHTERVPFREVLAVCSDLDLSINTGSTPWQITADPLSSTREPRPANVLLFAAPSFGSLPGSQWIGPASNSGLVPINRGDYTYEFTFCLCPGFGLVRMNLRGIVDDRARVFLNGQLLKRPPLEGAGTASVVAIEANFPFKAGINTLKVVVTNLQDSVTGLNINGSITVKAGRCEPACDDRRN